MGKIFRAAMIVMIFSCVTRAMGFIMKIILSRYLLAETLGEYQIAMSVFSVLLTLIASGLPLIVSRKVAYAAGSQTEINKTTSAGLCISLILSIIFSILLFVFKDTLVSLFKSKAIGEMVLSLTPALVFSSIYSILRAALWGQKRFFMISFSEFFEQLVRIAFLVVLLIAPPPNVSRGTIATFSLSIACIFSSLLVVIMYLKSGNRLSLPRGQMKNVIKNSSSITLSRTASSIVTMLIAFIIPLRLTTFGFSSAQAMAEFGIITGMALPLLTVPGTFISSIAVAIVPEISSQTTNIDGDEIKNKAALKTQINTALSAALIISFLFVPAFLALGSPIGEIVFKNARAGTYITAGSVLMITMGTTQITSSVLNAIGLEIKALKNYIAGAIVLLLGIWFLPAVLGGMSLVVSMLGMNIVTSILSLKMLSKRQLLNESLYKNALKLCVSTIISTGITYFTFNLLNKILPIFVSTVISGCLSVGVFFLLCYATNIILVKSFVSNKISKIFRRAH